MESTNTPKVFIESLLFSDGSKVDLTENQILVIVGSNNSGKSATLKEINNIFKFEHLPLHKNKVVKDAEFGRSGSSEDLHKFIQDNSFTKPEYGDARLVTVHDETNSNTQDTPIDFQNMIAYWSSNSKKLPYTFSLFFVNHLTNSRRLWVTLPAKAIQLFQDGPYHPIHFLLENEKLEEIFNKYFRLAFNKDIIVNRSPGPKVTLYVGERPIIESGEDKTSSTYIKKLISLPTLDMQGDGIKGFVGVMLSAIVSIQTLLLIDEPEVYLHPPQARMLGRMLGTEIPADKQIVIATHSEDILKGLMDANSSRVKIIRLDRRGDVNYVSTLDNNDIKTLWKDPILRYSNILSGIFHSKVILCEGDADCRFYSAVNDSLLQELATKNIDTQFYTDLLFVHCGGKDKMHVVIKALKKLGVPVSVAADIDVLNSERVLKNLISALNGDWEDIKKEFDVFNASVEKQRVELSTSSVKEKINKILEEPKSDSITNSKIEEIQNIIKKASPWESLKKAGKSVIPRGQEYQAFEKLVTYLRGIGLHVVEAGELECFVKSVGNKGPKWVNEVLEGKDFTLDTELNEAKEYVKQLVTG
ncbi:hypothetical protein GCM10028808_10450 [Spirosoma migulaei]